MSGCTAKRRCPLPSKTKFKNEVKKAAKDTKRDHLKKLLKAFAKRDVQPEDLGVS